MLLWFIIIVAFLLIIWPYAVYPLVLLVVSRRRPIGTSTEPVKSVSLLIAAYNEEEVIKEKLENSLALERGNFEFEIVVASDGSTDCTAELVRTYTKEYSFIRLLDFSERSGKVNALNKAVPQCKGDIVLLSDANAMYNPECLKYILPHFEDDLVGCVSGEKKILATDGAIAKNEGLYWRLESVIKRLESKTTSLIGADGACYAVRKSLFQSLPSETSVDDFLLSMRILESGHTVVYEPRAWSAEDPGQTAYDEFRRKRRIAAGNFYNLRFLHSFMRSDFLSFMFISHKLLRWISPLIFAVLTAALFFKAFSSETAWYAFLILLFSYTLPLLKYANVGVALTDRGPGRIITYFYLTVWAQYAGWKQYMAGTQKAVWDTVRQKK